MPQPHTRPTICIDLGKTRSRVVLADDTGVLATVDAPGTAGAATPGGADAISRRLMDQIARLPGADSACALGLGAAGTLTDPAAGEAIAHGLARALGIPVAVTSDIVSAHVGALGGYPGVVLVAGTGAVALGLSSSGELSRIDGWGPELGDLGGGSWIGREGLRAAALADAKISIPTALQGERTRLIAPELDAVRWLASTTSESNVGGRLAQLAPAVIAAAEHGDAIAIGVVERAIAHLGATAAAAAGPSSHEGAEPVHVSVLGGLNDSPFFSRLLELELRRRSLMPAAPIGNALDGARTIAHTTDLPHERYIHRAR